MPWKASDAKRHHAGLSAKQARQWAHVANSQLQTCLDKGGSQEHCEGQAIRAANAAVNKAIIQAISGQESTAFRLAASAPSTTTVTMQAAIAKSDDSQRRIWGWVSIAVRKTGETVVDLQDDIIDILDLEQAWYDYVAESGELNYMHAGPVRGHLIEAMVFTPEKLAALGLPPDSLPLGCWAGYHVPDAEDYQVLKQRGYFMFSIEGEAYREEVPGAAASA